MYKSDVLVADDSALQVPIQISDKQKTFLT